MNKDYKKKKEEITEHLIWEKYFYRTTVFSIIFLLCVKSFGTDNIKSIWELIITLLLGFIMIKSALQTSGFFRLEDKLKRIKK